MAKHEFLNGKQQNKATGSFFGFLKNKYYSSET